MTNEELLRLVIEAQAEGRCHKWDWLLPVFPIDGNPKDREWSLKDGKLFMNEYREDADTPIHILEIILDTEGAKAAYGDNASKEQIELCDGKFPTIFRTGITPFWKFVMQFILDSWNSNEGNNIKATLETAVSFLPKQ